MNARRLYIERARNRINRFLDVLRCICYSKTVRSFWQENGHCSLNDRCFHLYINTLVIFCKIYGANVAINYWKAFFSLYICRKAGEMLKYLHLMKIEGEIALLLPYCNNCYTTHYRRTHRKKDLYALSAFCITLKIRINSVYIFVFLSCFSISYQDIDIWTRLLRRLYKIEG